MPVRLVGGRDPARDPPDQPAAHRVAAVHLAVRAGAAADQEVAPEGARLPHEHSMLRHHMTVLTKDNRLKREVQRITAATASTADFGDLTVLESGKRPDVVIVDACTEPVPSTLKSRTPTAARSSSSSTRRR